MVMRAAGCGDKEHVVKALLGAVRELVEERLPGDVIDDVNSLLEKSGYNIEPLQKTVNGKEWKHNDNSVILDGDHLFVTGKNKYVLLLRDWETMSVMLKSHLSKQRRVEFKPNDALIFCDTLPSFTKSEYAHILDDVNALSLLRSHDCAIYRPQV